MKLIPMGSVMIVSKQEEKNYVTEGNIEIFQNKLDLGIVVEVSNEYADIYKVGEKVWFNHGAGFNKFYNGQQCLIIDARSPDKSGDVWFIEVDEIKTEK